MGLRGRDREGIIREVRKRIHSHFLAFCPTYELKCSVDRRPSRLIGMIVVRSRRYEEYEYCVEIRINRY